MSNISEMTFVGSRIRHFDSQIGEMGLMATVKKLATNTNTKVETSYDSEETKVALKKGPVVVVANHPHQSDVIVIMAGLPDRDDFSMVAMSSLLGMGKNIDRHIIPVYINHRAKNKKISENWQFRLFTKLHSYCQMGEDEEKIKNRQSISLASERLSGGQMVIIFPGGGSANGRWFTGVGYMIKGSTNPNLKIIMANISGTTHWDYFRLIPGLSRILPKIRVRFSAPIGVNEFKESEAREIAKKLETRYEKWLEN
ncbi:MAG: 1-acyl-sn-glycerol-3-phosphate acyltransferase [Candidatus Shapirobacteria bacterium]|jgi:1-acyl-sn-glycerol-3-phosphate acyltransferase